MGLSSLRAFSNASSPKDTNLLVVRVLKQIRALLWINRFAFMCRPSFVFTILHTVCAAIDRKQAAYCLNSPVQHFQQVKPGRNAP